MSYEDTLRSLKVKGNLYVGGTLTGQTAKNVWYVSGDITASGAGSSWNTAFKTISEAVTAASAGDTIYIAPKTTVAGATDPTSYAETITIPVGKPELSLIGIKVNRTQNGLPQIKKGSGAVALLTIQASGCTIMNLGFNGASSTGGGILLDDDSSTTTACGTAIYNCHFKNCKGHATDGRLGGAIMWSADGGAWQVHIANNRFYKNVCDICVLGTSISAIQDVVIEDNDFSCGSSTDVCIWGGGDSFADGFVFKNNTLGLIPSLAAGSVGVYFAGVTGGDLNGVGPMAFNSFGSAGTTTGYGANRATAKIGTGILLSGNYSSAGLIVRQ